MPHHVLCLLADLGSLIGLSYRANVRLVLWLLEVRGWYRETLALRARISYSTVRRMLRRDLDVGPIAFSEPVSLESMQRIDAAFRSAPSGLRGLAGKPPPGPLWVPKDVTEDELGDLTAASDLTTIRDLDEARMDELIANNDSGQASPRGSPLRQVAWLPAAALLLLAVPHLHWLLGVLRLVTSPLSPFW